MRFRQACVWSHPASRGYAATMARSISPRTGYLFAQPSALHGAARVFDLWSVYDEYNISESREADVLVAILQDWLALEDDARDIVAAYRASEAM